MASPFKLVRKAAKAVEGAVEKKAPKAAAKADRLKKPAVQTKGTQPMVEEIYKHAEKERSPEYPMATEPVFAPADPELTKKMVPQRSIQSDLPPPPKEGEWPLNERAKPFLEHRETLGRLLASDLSKVETPPLPFYSTGTVLEGLADKGGLTGDQPMKFMRDWSGQGAATSPRTATPQNLRNASYLQYRRAQGDPLTKARQKEEQAAGLYGFDKKGKANMNRPGFAMMGMHTGLGDEFALGTADAWKNPKPFTFRENWLGNMADVTADTHNIRKVLDAYDRLFPGTLGEDWFSSPEAFQRYIEGGGFPKEGQLPVGDIEDTLGGITRNKREMQTEYPIMQGPTNEAAKLLGISPAEAQERLWFEGGPRTGLKSPPMTIPDLLNAQIEKTARVLGIAPERVLKLWAQRGIPLASNEPVSDVPGASAVG